MSPPPLHDARGPAQVEDAEVLRELPAEPTADRTAADALPRLARRPPARPGWSWMASHPARLIALGLGSGLSPAAPGTVGSLWAWAAFLMLDYGLPDLPWGTVLAGGLLLGWWACTRAAQHLGRPDPSCIVWDEVLAMWLVLWVLMPTSLLGQALAFGVFRYFDAVKPGPVGWADGLGKRSDGQIGWTQGAVILFDDLVAAGCTLLVMAAGARLLGLVASV